VNTKRKSAKAKHTTTESESPDYELKIAATAQKSLQKVETATVQAVLTENDAMAIVFEATGVRDFNLAAKIVQQIHQSALSNRSNGEDVALAMLREMKPRTATESLLAVQMASVHNTAMAFLNRATLAGQPYDGSDSNLARATSLMRLFNEQLEAMAKLTGKASHQKVTVEHVHVHDGGQAIVGAVSAAPRTEGEGGNEETRKRTP